MKKANFIRMKFEKINKPRKVNSLSIIKVYLKCVNANQYNGAFKRI